jgi:hypothetical protein
MNDYHGIFRPSKEEAAQMRDEGLTTQLARGLKAVLANILDGYPEARQALADYEMIYGEADPTRARILVIGDVYQQNR